MLLDAHVLSYAWDESSPYNAPTRAFLEQALSTSVRIALPLQSISAFLRLSTDVRISEHPAKPHEASAVMRDWLHRPGVWMTPTSATSTTIFLSLVERPALTGRLVPDAQLAALAQEHGLPVVSADSDLARFPEITWINPLRGGA